VLLDNRAGHDVDMQFFGQRAVRIEVFLILGAERCKAWVVGEPVGQVVFWEDGKVAALGRGVTDEGYGFGMVCFYSEGL